MKSKEVKYGGALLLSQVRVMSEPSNMPPLWTSAYVANLARGELFRTLDGSLHIQQEEGGCSGATPPNGQSPVKCPAGPVNPWEPSFSQPASDYLAFRNKLERNSVSLENVIVREAEGCLIGTVKVKNIAYDKQVTIRCTRDGWRSHEDVDCAYVEQPGLAGQTAVRNLYDTFRFRLALPDKDSGSQQLEFCVRYCTEGADFWDNNAGANYVVKKRRDVSGDLEPKAPADRDGPADRR